MAGDSGTTSDRSTSSAEPTTDGFVRLHSNIGWWTLLLFVTLGIVLESLHGFKVSWYLNVGEETRRLLWRLAHAHGTFLALVNIVFGLAVKQAGGNHPRWRSIASRCLIGATIALPAGFFLGGTSTYDGDPGIGIALLPLGAAMLWIAILLTACKWPGEKQPAARPVTRKRRPRAAKT